MCYFTWQKNFEDVIKDLNLWEILWVRASFVVLMVKNLPEMWEIRVQSLQLKL